MNGIVNGIVFTPIISLNFVLLQMNVTPIWQFLTFGPPHLVPRMRTLWPTGPFFIRWWHYMTTMHKAQRIWNSVKAIQLTFSVKVRKHSGVFSLLLENFNLF